MNKYISFLFFIFLSFTILDNLQAQDTVKSDSLRKNALNIFLDCYDCSMEYIKKEITFVNYVRDQKDAQLYIMVTSQSTGSGGIEYTMKFMGRKENIGTDNTLKYRTTPNETEDEIRKKGLQFLKMGLMPYVANTPLANEIKIDFISEAEPDKLIDPWKSWIFDINGSSYINGEESIKSSYFSSYVNASKVTEKYKINFYADYSSNQNEYKLDDTTTFKSHSDSKNFKTIYVKSIGEHWSVGATVSASTSTFNNLKHSYRVFPAIEYDFYKYSESTRRQLCFLYEIGGNNKKYIDTTIYNKIDENLFMHALSLSYKVKETWGSIDAKLYGSQYFHDLSKNNLNLYTNLEIRIYKGLSFNFYAYVALIHDQLSLRKGGASVEEILTYQKQLASQYSYYTSVGLTYTFGSIYNNVVNPRFGF